MAFWPRDGTFAPQELLEVSLPNSKARRLWELRAGWIKPRLRFLVREVNGEDCEPRIWTRPAAAPRITFYEREYRRETTEPAFI